MEARCGAQRAIIDLETGPGTWPNGADFNPDVPYAAITGVAVDQRLVPAEAS